MSNVEALSISTDKTKYYFGDYLTFTIQVDSIKDTFATMWIIDSAEKSSSAINLPITDLIVEHRAPFPFELETYPQDTYTLYLEYNGKNASTQFSLQDSGKIVIPTWIKDVGRLWVDDVITADQFVTTITQFLITAEIIDITPKESDSDMQSEIPKWIKTNTKWWTEGLIDDETFASGLAYLIETGVIVV
jgi:hypothetical protein